MNSKLLELFEIGGKNDFEFNYKLKEGEENSFSLDFENKKINVLIGNPESDTISTDVDKLINELKKLL